MISTRDARIEPVSSAVFERMSASTGGQAYFARNWQEEQKAFAGIRDDLAHTYAIYYYPEANPNNGWRAITVKLVGPKWRSTASAPGAAIARVRLARWTKRAAQ